MNSDAIATFLVEDAVERGVLLPDAAALVALLESAFYASLSSDEGVPVRCDLLIIDPDKPDPIRPKAISETRWRCVPFAERVPLNDRSITKLAAAADPWATALAVYHDDSGWFLWAIVDQQVHYNRWRHFDAESGPHNPQTYRISIEDTAYLSINWDYDTLLRSIRGDVLLGAEPVLQLGPFAGGFERIVQPFAAILDARLSDVAAYTRHPFWPATIRREVRSVIQRILLHIVRYRHGGALLITSAEGVDLVPKFSVNYERLTVAVVNQLITSVLWRDAWDAILTEDPILPATFGRYRESDRARKDTAREISGCVQSIASLARVDGLVWLSDRLVVNGFGVEIRTENDPTSVVACGDAEASEELLEPRDPQMFGMRHRSMMRVCFNHPGALGFVVSQDGPVRAMLRENDRLLLWEDIRLRDE